MRPRLITNCPPPLGYSSAPSKENSSCTYPTPRSRKLVTPSKPSASQWKGRAFIGTFAGLTTAETSSKVRQRQRTNWRTKYVRSIQRELGELSFQLEKVAGLSCVEVFALDDEMLDLANKLALSKAAQKPFDHAILAEYSSHPLASGTAASGVLPLPKWIAICSLGARKEVPRMTSASCTMTLTFGSMATLPCSSLRAPMSSSD